MATSWIQRSRALLAQRRRIVQNGRLVYFHTTANEAYWEGQWSAVLTRAYFARFLRGELDTLERPFTRYLPKTGTVLEAGCGTGQVVAALRARGYDAVGIDYAEQTIDEVHKILPDLPLSCGDLTHLDQVAPETFAAIISLGVVEHRREGPEPFLDESRRILKPGGMLLISVPWFNPLRQRRARKGAYRDDVTGKDFYQYAFSVPEFTAYLNKAGFKVIDECPYDQRTGLGEDVPLMAKVEKILPLAKGVYRLSSMTSGVLNPLLGHMRLYVAQKV
jgi:SAM-dependent methyltransferase